MTVETINIASTEETPSFELNKETGVFKIEGMSLPEDPLEVYEPILKWFREYATNPNESTTVEIYLGYINSMSIKQIFNIMLVVKNIEGAKVIWKYASNDQLMEEKGKEFQLLIDGLNIELQRV